MTLTTPMGAHDTSPPRARNPVFSGAAPPPMLRPAMTTLPSSLPGAAPPIGRPARWRLLPTFLFTGLLATLLISAIGSLLVKPRRPQGLPDSPGAQEALLRVRDGVFVTVRDMRFRAAILGGEAHDGVAATDVPGRIERARALLETDQRRGVRDPRLDAALGTLALARHDYRRAERDFRRAIEAAPHYGEGRLGLGVTLALRADITPEHWQSRALRLQAIAQFAAVDRGDPAYPHAVYDRALQLARVGRAEDAGRFAADYFRLEQGGEWSVKLARELQSLPPARRGGERVGEPASTTRP